MRISDILYWHGEHIKGRAHPLLSFRSAPFSNDLITHARPFIRDGLIKHFRNLKEKRTFLSKSRYMCGRQCSKKLWQTVYDPEPAEEQLPGTVKGMGIEVGIRARLMS